MPSDPVIDAYKKDIDRTLLRENLRLTPEQRLLKLIELQRFADELRRAGKEWRKRA
jgi:hypothetical protein